MKLITSRVLAVFALVLILGGVNYSIANKEKQLATGKIAYLKLRPVDPRSLMQGDYMALRFTLADDIKNALPKPEYDVSKSYWRNRNRLASTNGHVIVVLDKGGIASFKSLHKEGEVLAENELRMQFRVRNGRVKFATNAFFFQEGAAKVYEKAKYGQFRVSNNGGLLLAAMFDEKLNKLEPKNE